MPDPPCDASYDPYNIVTRLEVGKWNDKPEYQEAFKRIRQEQSAVFRLVETLDASHNSNTPGSHLKNSRVTYRDLTPFEQQLLTAAGNLDTAYIKRFLRALTHRKKGELPWRFTTFSLACLAAIYLREDHPKHQATKSEVQRLVIAWQATNQQRKSRDISQWPELFREPVLRRLLSELR
jgi:hypothetical protein